MKDLKRIRQTTLLYPELQGLRMLPLGLFFLLNAVQRLELFLWLGRQGDLDVLLPALLIAGALWFWLGHYYERTFGKVEPLRSQGCLSATNIALLALFVGVIVLENVLYRRNLAPPVSLIGLSLGGVILIAGTTSRRWYYVLSGALLAAASFLPLVMGVGVGDPLYGSLGIVFLFLLGFVFLFSGLLDHFRLTRSFSGAPRGFQP